MAALNTTPVLVTTLVHGPAQRSRGGTRRIVSDLATAYGGFVLVRLGRGGTTALDVGVGVRVNRLITYVETGAGPLPYVTVPATYTIGHPDPVASRIGAIEAAVQSTVSVNAAAGDTSLTPASIAGFAAGDLISLDGAGFDSYDRWEVNRVNRIAGGGTTLQLDTPLLFAHTAAQADPIINRAEVWQLPVDGGCSIEIIVDYGESTTGDDVDVEIFVQAYTKDTTL